MLCFGIAIGSLIGFVTAVICETRWEQNCIKKGYIGLCGEIYEIKKISMKDKKESE